MTSNSQSHIPLSRLVSIVSDRAYVELVELRRTAERQSDADRRESLSRWLLEQRHRALQLLAMLDWLESHENGQPSEAQILARAEEEVGAPIRRRLEAMAQCAIEAREASGVFDVAMAPRYDVHTAMRVLTTGLSGTIPSCVEKTLKGDTVIPATEEFMRERVFARILRSFSTIMSSPSIRDVVRLADDGTLCLHGSCWELNIEPVGDTLWHAAHVDIDIKSHADGGIRYVSNNSDAEVLVKDLITQHMSRFPAMEHDMDDHKAIHAAYSTMRLVCASLLISALHAEADQMRMIDPIGNDAPQLKTLLWASTSKLSHYRLVVTCLNQMDDNTGMIIGEEASSEGNDVLRLVTCRIDDTTAPATTKIVTTNNNTWCPQHDIDPHQLSFEMLLRSARVRSARMALEQLLQLLKTSSSYKRLVQVAQVALIDKVGWSDFTIAMPLFCAESKLMLGIDPWSGSYVVSAITPSPRWGTWGEVNTACRELSEKLSKSGVSMVHEITEAYRVAYAWDVLSALQFPATDCLLHPGLAETGGSLSSSRLCVYAPMGMYEGVTYFLCAKFVDEEEESSNNVSKFVRYEVIQCSLDETTNRTTF